jgi:hypothetical protein
VGETPTRQPGGRRRYGRIAWGQPPSTVLGSHGPQFVSAEQTVELCSTWTAGGGRPHMISGRLQCGFRAKYSTSAMASIRTTFTTMISGR